MLQNEETGTGQIISGVQRVRRVPHQGQNATGYALNNNKKSVRGPAREVESKEDF